jgi:primary-amine oxidase
MSIAPPTATRRHPLDQLSADEISRAVAVLRGHPTFPARACFRVVGLREPSRAEVREFERGGQPPTRMAHASVFDLDRGHAVDALVDLDSDAILGIEPLDPRRQPGLAPAEQAAIRESVLRDPRWQDAMRARGVDDLEHVAFETGPAGRFGTDFDDRPRLGRTLTFLRPPGTLNYYAHPVQGLVVVVDILTSEVLDVIDEGVVPVPRRGQEFHDPSPSDRPPLREIRITQPEGPSFSMSGRTGPCA